MNTGKRITTHTKPWRGCQTCKLIHVRCDEGRPVCSNCNKYRRVCEYAPPSDSTSLSSAQGPQFLQANHGLTDTWPPSATHGHTLPPTDHGFASDPTLTNASIPSSLDPYSESLLPLTPAKRELLAFCKSFIVPFMIYPSRTGSSQAD